MKPIRLTDGDWHAIASNRAKDKTTKVTLPVLVVSLSGLFVMILPDMLAGGKHSDAMNTIWVMGFLVVICIFIYLTRIIRKEHNRIYKEIRNPEFVPTKSDWKAVASRRALKVGNRAVAYIWTGTLGLIISFIPFILASGNIPRSANSAGLVLLILFVVLNLIFIVDVIYLMIHGRKLADLLAETHSLSGRANNVNKLIITDDDGEL